MADRHGMRFLAVCAIFVLASAGQACDLAEKLGKALGIIQKDVIDVENILDDAIQQLGAESADWQSIVQGAIDKLPKAEATVRADLEQLMQRGIHTAGIEARCDVSYLNDMLIQGLKAIRAKITGQPVPAPAPFICDASPSAIDMNLAPANRTSIELFGYNLDVGGVTVRHVTTGGASDVTSTLNVISPFKQVINLGLNGVPLSRESQRLLILMGSAGTRSIPVIQAYPEVCETGSPKHVNPGSIKVIPDLVHGDREFYGHGPCIAATATLFTAENDTQLRVGIDVEVWECPDDFGLVNGDQSKARKHEERTLYTTDAGWAISEIRSPMIAILRHIDTSTDPERITDQGLVSSWAVVGDTDGDDIGETHVEPSFARITLTLRETGDCVTENQLTRMLAERQVSTVVVERLRTQRPALWAAGAQIRKPSRNLRN